MPFSLYLGPYQPFLEQELALAVKALRASGSLSPLVVLVPNRALVRHLSQDLARRNGSTFNLRVLTLHQYLIEFTEEKWLREGARLLPESLVPWVLRENAHQAKPSANPFRGVEAMPGFYKTLRSTLSDLRQGGFTSEQLATSSKAVAKDRSRQRLSEKLAEFSRLLAGHRGWKQKKGWKDLEDLYDDALALAAPQASVWTYGFYDASVLQQRVLLHLTQKPEIATSPSAPIGAAPRNDGKKKSLWFIPYEEGHPAFDYAKPFVEWAKAQGEVKKVGKYESGKGTALGRLQDNIFKTDNLTEITTPKSAPTLQESQGPEQSRRVGAGARDDSSFENSDIKVLLCPGEPREVREMVRTLTEEAERQKTRFSNCGLLLRQLETYRRMIVPAFEGQGVPLAKKPPVFLMETPEAKAFLLLLECFQRDFPRETLMDFLASPNLSPEGFGAGEEDWNPHLWDQASKEAAVVEGKEAWLDRLQAYQKLQSDLRSIDEEGMDDKETRSLSVFRTKVLKVLLDGGLRFEKEKHWAGKARILFDLAQKLFLPSKAKKELETLRRGVDILSKDLSEVAGEDLDPILCDLMEEVRIPWDVPEPGGVEVTDLMQARGVPFDVVVLPGLVEQGFPRMPRPDPLLLEEEREILNGLAERRSTPPPLTKGDRGGFVVPQGEMNISPCIPLKREGRLEEKLLFLLAARSAQKCLVLTASHLHPGTGAPRIPSSYLHEALRAVTGERQTNWDDSSYVRKIAVSDWVRDEGRVDDLEEVLGRFQEARAGNPLPAQAYAGEKPFFEEARRLLKERQGSRKFTAYDGIFQDDEALEKLRQSHSLKDTTLSASRLETYAACPLKYFYRYVLGLKVHPEPERVFQLDPAEKGTLMHSILEETLSRGVKEGWLKERNLGSTSFRGGAPIGAGADVGISVQRSEIATAQNAPIGAGPRNDTYDSPGFQSGLLLQKALEVLEEETQKAFKRLEKEGIPGSPALWEWSQFIVRKDLQKELKKVLKDKDWTPVDLEKAFGRKGKPEVSFPTQGGSFRLEGFMDRVDLSSDGKRLRVVDYKSGSKEGFKKDSVKEGTKIQMPLYLWACRTLYPDAVPEQAVYEFLTAKGDYGEVGFDAKDWKKVEEPLRALLTTAAEAVEQGLFPAAAKACKNCDYRTLCGPGAEKRGEKKREDGKAKKYFELEELV